MSRWLISMIVLKKSSPTFLVIIETEHVHFKFLIYYLVRYMALVFIGILSFTNLVAYRLYLEKLVMNRGFISC